MNKGWVKLWREQFANWVSARKPWCDGYAWSYLYAQANHKQRVVNFRDEYITVNRGELVTSKLKLQHLFGWGVRRLNGYLTALKSDNMITYRSTNRYTHITVLNYGKFQGIGCVDDTTEVLTDAPTGALTESKQVATNKNDKECKELNNPTGKTPTREMISIFTKIFKEFRDGSPQIDQGKDGSICKVLYKQCLADRPSAPLLLWEERIRTLMTEHSIASLGGIKAFWNTAIPEKKDQKKKTYSTGLE